MRESDLKGALNVTKGCQGAVQGPLHTGLFVQVCFDTVATLSPVVFWLSVPA